MKPRLLKTYLILAILTFLCLDFKAQVDNPDFSSELSIENASEESHLIPDEPMRIYEPDTSSFYPEPVGSPACHFSVSSGGGATYSIKIAAPKGLNGMEPDLSLVYNSQNGNDIAGWGFGLSCTSSIRFACSDIYHDGSSRGVTHTWDDPLTLDGRRLTLKSGIPGETGCTYSLEGDPFTIITLLSDSNTGKPYFEMQTPDGRRLVYGKNSSLHIITAGNTEQILGWNLYCIYDIHDNATSYTYTSADNLLYLNGIHYNGKHIYILYETRQNDPQTFYIGNVACTMRRRIRALECKDGDELFRRYDLTYDTSSDQSGTPYSRLVSVRESNSSGESLKPVTIDWRHLPSFGLTHNSRTFAPVSIEGNPNIYSRSHMAADVNGDGISDIIHMYLTDNIENQSLTEKNTHVLIRLSSVGPSGSVSFSSPLDIIAPPTFASYCGEYSHNNLSNCDIDGDGISDLCLMSLSGAEGQIHTSTYSVITASSIISGHPEAVTVASVTTNYNDDEPLYTICDFDNDGRSEIIHLEKVPVDSEYRCYYFYGNGASAMQSSYSVLSLPSEPKHLFSGDYNNDGLADIAVFCQTGYKVFFNSGNGHSSHPFPDNRSYTGSGIDYKERTFQGDFNGDGVPDFIMNGNSSEDYFVAYGNSDGSFTLSAPFQTGLYDQYSSHDNGRFTLMVTDLDHDGMSDFMAGKAVYDGGSSIYEYTEFRWFRSTGGGFELMRTSRTNEKDDARPEYIFSGDFTGNGQPEIMNWGNDIYSQMPSRSEMSGNAEETVMPELSDGMESPDSVVATLNRTSSYDEFHLYTHTGMDASSGRVRSITDGFGNVTSVSYSSLVNGGIYTKGDTCRYPLNTISAPLSVVSHYSVTDGAAGVRTSRCRYEGLMVHVAGKGLLGFRSTTVTDSISGKSVSEEILEFDTVRYEPLRKAALTISDGEISSIEERYLASTAGNSNLYCGNYWLHPYSKTSTDIYGNSVTEYYAYSSAYGYAESVYRSSDESGDLYTGTEYDAYVQKRWFHRPTSWHTLSSHPDSPGEENIVHYTATYNNKGDCLSLTENAGTSLARTTTYTYDTYGNMTSKSVQTTADSCLTTTYAYSGGRDLVSVSTSPTTATHSYTYDIWGNQLTHTETISDTIHNTTVNTYDGWGNLVRSVSPDGVITTYHRGWGSGLVKCYYIMEWRQGAPWKKTWYDSSGREVSVESVGPDYVIHNRSVQYNGRGLPEIKKEVLGLRQTCDTLYYDSMDRLTDERHTGSGRTSYSYGANTVTSVHNGITTVRQTDPFGNISSVSENGTLVTYRYSSCGKPKEVISAGHSINLTYDNMGRRLSMSDPDAGTATWEYDRAGNVVRHTDAMGRVTVNSYLSTGKLKKSVVDGVSHWYRYDPSSSMLETEWRTGYERRTWHDRYGRLYYSGKWKGEGDGTVYRYHYYDSYGRETLTARSHGPSTTYMYDENGYHIQTKVGNRIVWRLGSFTGLKEVSYALDDSIAITKTYDHSGRTLSLERSTSYIDVPVPLSSMRSLEDSGVEAMDSSVSQPSRLSPDAINGIDRYQYTYDLSTGNVLSSTYTSRGSLPVIRRYEYDSLDRLIKSKKTWMNSGQTLSDSISVDYGNDGNILFKSGIGQYTYNSVRPHAVTEVENAEGLLPESSQAIEYNIYGKASHIDDGSYNMDIQYGSDRQRWKSVLVYDDGSECDTVRTVLYNDDKEIISCGGRRYSITYLDEGVICVKDLHTGVMSFYLSCCDHLGNVTKIVRGNRTEVFRAEYDAWGRQSVSQNDIGFIRGYTGHEMLPEFGLVNMNGRMYDPLLGRFLSTDDYVQLPESAQGFNRYSYCLNNPLKYVDPSGELFGLATIIGFFKGLGKFFKSGNPFSPFTEAYKNFKLELKLFKGLFIGNFKQIVSRLTFESLQTVFGFLYSYGSIVFHDTMSVNHFDGATYVINKTNGYEHHGITIGSYINITSSHEIPRKDGKFDPTLEPLYMHEYGHYLQSQRFGLGYIPFIGLPSLASEVFNPSSHKRFWTETYSNRLAAEYFSKYGIDWENGEYEESSGSNTSNIPYIIKYPLY